MWKPCAPGGTTKSAKTRTPPARSSKSTEPLTSPAPWNTATAVIWVRSNSTTDSSAHHNILSLRTHSHSRTATKGPTPTRAHRPTSRRRRAPPHCRNVVPSIYACHRHRRAGVCHLLQDDGLHLYGRHPCDPLHLYDRHRGTHLPPRRHQKEPPQTAQSPPGATPPTQRPQPQRTQ